MTAAEPIDIIFEEIRSTLPVALPSSLSAVVPTFLNSRIAPPLSAVMRICSFSINDIGTSGSLARHCFAQELELPHG